MEKKLNLKKSISLDDIKKIIDNKDKILSIASQGGDKPWLAPNSDTVLKNVLDRIENMYNNYEDYSIDEKEKALKYIQGDYNTVINDVSNISNKLKEKKKSLEKLGYKDLSKDINVVEGDIETLSNSLINKEEIKKDNVIKESTDDIEGIGKEETKNITPVYKVNSTNISQPTNVGVQPLTYQDRKLVKDPTTGTWGYESKKTGLVKGGFKDEVSAKSDIDQELGRLYTKENVKQLEKGSEAQKDFINKGKLRGKLTDKDVAEWLSQEI